MKKKVNLMSLIVMLSVNVFNPISYAQENALQEIVPEEVAQEVLHEINGEGMVVSEEKDENADGDNNKMEDEIGKTSILDVEKHGEKLEEEQVYEKTLVEDIPTIEGEEEFVIEEFILEKDGSEDEVVSAEEKLHEELLLGDEISAIKLIEEEIVANLGVQDVEKIATLIPGSNFNEKMKILANGDDPNIGVSFFDVNINAIRHSDELLDSSVNVALSDSPYAIFIRYDEKTKTIYYYTDANKIIMNQDSSYMFSNLTELSVIDLKRFDTSSVLNMKSMFENCFDLVNLDLTNYDTHMLQNMDGMFKGCPNLTSIVVSDNFVVSNELLYSSRDTFLGDMKLVGENGTNYDDSCEKGEYDGCGFLATKDGLFRGSDVVLFDAGGLSAVNPQLITDIFEPEDPEKANSVFLGWYTVMDEKWDFNNSVDGTLLLYAKWECDSESMEINGQCIRKTPMLIESIDGKEMYILGDDIENVKNGGWRERAKGPCPSGYHVPTMGELNTLFVSWCEKHTIQNDGICDVRDLERNVWEEGMEDFIYTTKAGDEDAFLNAIGENVLDAFTEELNLKRGVKVVENCYYFEGYGTICNDEFDDDFLSYEVGKRFSMASAYWTSNMYRESDTYPMSRFYVASRVIDPLTWTKPNDWNLNVRCFKDDYVAPSRMVLVDIIDENMLEEYKDKETRIRSGEEALPQNKQFEIALMEGLLGYESREGVKNQLSVLLIPELENKYEGPYSAYISDEEKEYYMNLKNLIESVLLVDYGYDDVDDVLELVKGFDWAEPKKIDCYDFELELSDEETAYCESYRSNIYKYDAYDIKGYLLYLLGDLDFVPHVSEEELVEEIEAVKQKFYRWVDGVYDFLSEQEKLDIKRNIDELENYDGISVINMLRNVYNEIYALLTDKYQEEFDALPGFEKEQMNLIPWVLDVLEMGVNTINWNTFVGAEFVEESKMYLGTDDWIRGDGTIDVKEMVMQEYLQSIFAEMAYRLVVTPEMSSDEIIGKIIRIKGINLGGDERLGIFGVSGEEINLNDGLRNNIRGYLWIKEIEKEQPKGNGYSGGGGSLSRLDKSHGLADDEGVLNIKNGEPKAEESKQPTQGKTLDTSIPSKEVFNAHQWAYSNGLTKYRNAGEARMDDPLNRSEMAKISSIFAEQFLDKLPNDKKQEFCLQYPDLWKVEDDMKFFIIESCKLGYMGYESNGIDALAKFRPYTPVTVAEAATILSRIVWGNENAMDGKDWYKGHLYATYNHGLIDDIKDPTKRSITRREAYLMLYRLINFGE